MEPRRLLVVTAAMQLNQLTVTITGTDTATITANSDRSVIVEDGTGKAVFNGPPANTVNGIFVNPTGSGDVVNLSQLDTSAVYANLQQLSVVPDAQGASIDIALPILTKGPQSYGDPIVLQADTTLDSTYGGKLPGGGNITFGDRLDSDRLPRNLTVSAGNSDVQFAGTVGGNQPLATLAVSGAQIDLNGGSITTTTSETYNGDVLLTADTTATVSGVGNITFNGLVDSAKKEATGAAGFGLTANTAGVTTFDQQVGAGLIAGANPNGLAFLTTDARGTTAINGRTVSTIAAQTYADNVTLGAAATTLTSTGGGDIDFAQKVDGASALTINTAGTTTFGGPLGGTTALISIATDAPGTTAINGGAITTAAEQTYGDNVTLGAAATTLTSTGGGDVDLAQKVDGASALTINTAGTTTFAGAVGATQPLAALTVRGGLIDLNGGSITTAGDQTYNNDALLTANTTAAVIGVHDITFNGAVDSANPGAAGSTGFGLTANTLGTTTFGGTVGSGVLAGANPQGLAFLTTDAPGATVINGSAVTTTGDQSYGDAVMLGASTTTLMSSGGGNIAFAKTVDGVSALTVNTKGATVFDGAIGGSGVSVLTSLTIDAGGTTDINAPSITTTGSQTYGDAVTLTTDTMLNTLSGGDVVFNSTVDSSKPGTSSLVVGTGVGPGPGKFGLTQFHGNVGAASPLRSLIVLAAGPFVVNSGVALTASGDIAIGVVESAPGVAGDDIDIQSGATVQSTGGHIVFDAGDNLSIAGALAAAASIIMRGDFENNDPTPGTTILLAGTINSPTVNVVGGFGNDEIDVQNTQSGTTTTIDAGTGDDVINVSSTAPATGGTLATIAGALVVDGGDGQDTLQLDDSGDTTARAGTLTSSAITGLAPATIQYQNVEKLQVRLGAGGNLNIQGTPAGTSVNVTGGGAVNLGGSGNQLDALLGSLTITAAGSLILNDQSATAGHTYDVTGTAITRHGPPADVTIGFSQIGTLGIRGGVLDDTFDVFLPIPAATTLEFDGGGGMNLLKVVGSASAPNAAVLTPLTSNFARTNQATVNDPTTIQIKNFSCVDMYGAVNQPNDFVNQTAESSILIGGNGNDTLVGGTAPDILFGGAGNNLLIAGGVAGGPGTDYVFADFLPAFLPDGSLNTNIAYWFTPPANTGTNIIDAGGGTVVFNSPITAIANATTTVPIACTQPGVVALVQSIFDQAVASDPCLAMLRRPPADPPQTLYNYVNAAFQSVLGRPASAADLAFWVDQLDNGTPRSALANTLTHSDEYYGNFINATYRQFLERTPDAAGLAFWIAQMRGGLSDEQLEASLIASSEFYLHASGTDKAWVDAVYLDLLGRAADASGEAFWVGQLQTGVSRHDVAFGFSASLERERQRVAADYNAFLGRQPDQQGIDFWVEQFAKGLSNEDLIAGFVASEEYFTRHSS